REYVHTPLKVSAVTSTRNWAPGIEGWEMTLGLPASSVESRTLRGKYFLQESSRTKQRSIWEPQKFTLPKRSDEPCNDDQDWIGRLFAFQPALIPPIFAPLTEQEPSASAGVALVAQYTQAFGKRALESFAIRLLHGQGPPASRRRDLPFISLGRYIDVLAAFKLRRRITGQHRFYSLRSHPPLCYQPVGGQPSLQGRRRDSVLVRVVAPRDRSQLLDIQMRVLDLQGIEGPLHQLKATSQRILALVKLQAAPEPPVAIALAHGQHLRVQVELAVPRGRDCKCEGNQFFSHAFFPAFFLTVASRWIANEGSYNLPADLRGDNEHADGNQFRIRELPHFF